MQKSEKIQLKVCLRISDFKNTIRKDELNEIVKSDWFQQKTLIPVNPNLKILNRCLFKLKILLDFLKSQWLNWVIALDKS